ncbi:MAG: HAD family hydrolase [Acidobacteriota bacterium]|nr:MAG: HAD family hydrolase [Acidobacteriota bacterium]
MRELSQRIVVLLDAGGTLITLDYDRVRCALGVDDPPTDEQLDRAEARARVWANVALRRQLAPRELWNGYFRRLLLGAGAAAPAVPGALTRLWELNRERGLWRRPVPGARAVLERLRAAGRRLGVISNAEGQVEADLRAAGFGDLLETVIDSHLVGVAKPDRRIFEIALERMRADPGQAVYVGDVPAFDVDGPRAAGIPAILLDPHGIHEDIDVKRISGLQQLPEALGL